jgi:hypothetical protein
MSIVSVPKDKIAQGCDGNVYRIGKSMTNRLDTVKIEIQTYIPLDK